VTPDSARKRRAAPPHSDLTWNTVAQCEHFFLARHVSHDIVRVTRISDAYPDVRALGQAHDWLLKQFEAFDRPKVVLVWDGRRGKLRNDPEFERAMARYLPLVTSGWREFISLNNTPVVKVQFFRWNQERISSPIRAFNDEREAFEHALDVSAGRSPARSPTR
jgi:hypothetical protein